MTTAELYDEEHLDDRIARLLENSRRTLAAYGILDSERESQYDELCELARTVSGWPYVLLSFFDGRRQWYKSSVGLDVKEGSAAASFCLNIVLHGHSHLLVADAANDERFRDNIHVVNAPHIRAYAGIPIRDKDTGVTLGTLAALNNEVSTLSKQQVDQLTMITHQVEALLENRRENLRRKHAEQRLASANRQLEAFSLTIAHDLRAPLRQQSAFAKLLTDEYAQELDGDGKHLLSELSTSAGAADKLVDELLTYARIADAAGSTKEIFSVRVFLEEVCELANLPKAFHCIIASNIVRVEGARVALRHIALNLISNAHIHHDRKVGTIQIRLGLRKGRYYLEVEDDGPGMTPVQIENCYASRSMPMDAVTKRRRGLGSYIVTELVAAIGGEVFVQSGVRTSTLPDGWQPLYLDDNGKLVEREVNRILDPSSGSDYNVGHGDSVLTKEAKTTSTRPLRSLDQEARGTIVQISWPAV